MAIILVTALHKCISNKMRSHSEYPWLVQPASFSYIKKGQVNRQQKPDKSHLILAIHTQELTVNTFSYS